MVRYLPRFVLTTTGDFGVTYSALCNLYKSSLVLGIAFPSSPCMRAKFYAVNQLHFAMDSRTLRRTPSGVATFSACVPAVHHDVETVPLHGPLHA